MSLHVKDPSWRKQISEDLLLKLYVPLRSRLLAELDNMLVEHRSYRKLPNTANVHAHYLGKNYLLPADHIGGEQVNKYVELAPKFHRAMDNIKDDYTEMDEERREIKNFLRGLLNICNSTADVAALLPRSLFKELYTTQLILSPKQIDKFNRENLCYLSTIKKRMVENLLLK